jgi:CheY-like chemotaxis protein
LADPDLAPATGQTQPADQVADRVGGERGRVQIVSRFAMGDLPERGWHAELKRPIALYRWCDSVPSHATAKGAAAMAQSDNRSPTVFVIDDDDDVRASIAGLLKSAGLRAETFESAQEFLSRERSEGPGCLVLDFSLPSMTGFQAQRELSAAGVQLPTIFISGYNDNLTSAGAIDSGAVAFLTKPFRDQDLLDAIREALNRDRAMREE